MRRSLSLLLLWVSFPLYAQVDIKQLAKDLKSRDAEVRESAANSLGYLETAEAAELLAQALSDREPRVRAAAASALWKTSRTSKSAIPALRNALSDSDLSVIARAAGALIAMDVPQQDVAAPLRKVLQGGNPYDRFEAARLLIGVEPAANLVAPIVDYLRSNLAAERYEQREFATKTLQRLAETQDRTQIDPLMAQLRGGQSAIVPSILSALAALKPPPDRWTDTLIGYLGNSDAGIRGRAAGLLGRQNSAADVSKWTPLVARLTKDADAAVRGAAVGALGNAKGLAHEGLTSVLQVISSEQDDALRARAAEVAGEIADKTFPIDTAIRAAMGKDALPVLSAALEKDPKDDVREKAFKSLLKLQVEPASIVPVLARVAVSGRKTGIRTDALIALSGRGRDAASAKAMIEPLVNDPDPVVARIAKSTLESMQSTSVTSAQKPTMPAAAPSDPAARERGLAYLRANDEPFTDGGFARALRGLDQEMVQAFLDAGMSPNQRFNYGELPLQVALSANSKCGAKTGSVVKLLLDRGADANGSDDNGNTVLMTASKKCDGETVKTLIKAGAKAKAVNATGFSALDEALTFANTSAAAALVAAGARLTAEQAKSYREEYQKSPKVLEIISMATKK